MRSSEAQKRTVQKEESQGGKGTGRRDHSDLGSCRNSPSAPSNEPHTSSVPGYEAVEATGVASVGAIEPASSLRNYQTVPDIRRGGRGRPGGDLLRTPPTESHRLNSLTTDPTGAKRLCLVCSLGYRRVLGKFVVVQDFAHRIAPEIRTRERDGSDKEVPGGRVPRRAPVGQMRVARRRRQKRTNEMGIPCVSQQKERWRLMGSQYHRTMIPALLIPPCH